MSYMTYAMNEFRAAGWVDENGKFDDEMQQLICTHVLKLLEVFYDEGHSGTSAPYAIKLFSSLAAFEPIVPLTGEDWEWNEVSSGPLGSSQYMKYQNKRCGHVFKDEDGQAYDGNGIVFYDIYIDEDGNERKSHFTCRESRVNIEFPYTPTIEYREANRDE